MDQTHHGPADQEELGFFASGSEPLVEQAERTHDGLAVQERHGASIAATVLASLSIDLDALEHYHRVHGIPEPSPGEDPVYGKAVERFGELCARLGIRGTAFCVGRNLDHPRAAAAVRRLAEGGHEVANHSFSHDYALSSRSPA